MYRVIVYNKMNNIVRYIFTKDVKFAIKRARSIAQRIGKNGGWTMVEAENFEQVTYFDYTKNS